MNSWSQRVKQAREIDASEDRCRAFCELITEALHGYQLHLAPSSERSGPVDPEHYRPEPHVNFDYWLEEQEYWPRAGRRGLLGPRTGYCFSVSGVGYAVLGPMAVEPHTPHFSRMHADHELYHATHHLRPTQTRADRELETWLYCFVRYFHLTSGIRKRWKPLADYFEEATPEMQDRAVARLLEYFDEQAPRVRVALVALLGRRQRDMGDNSLVRRLTRMGRELELDQARRRSLRRSRGDS